LTGLHLSAGSADFRLLDKRVVCEIKNLPERMLFLRGMISWMGFRQLDVPYTPAKRYAGKSQYTLRKMLSLAVTGATSFSLKPLRLAVYMGLIVAFLGCLLTAYVLYMRLFNGSVISGWASTLCVILILGGVQLLMMGIIGEYIGMIFMESKHRPQYIISQTTFEGVQHDEE
jgi:dolichol-phosphate mannosyltransferase